MTNKVLGAGTVVEFADKVQEMTTDGYQIRAQQNDCRQTVALDAMLLQQTSCLHCHGQEPILLYVTAQSRKTGVTN